MTTSILNAQITKPRVRHQRLNKRGGQMLVTRFLHCTPVLPQNSYIDVRHFASAKDLAKYLLYLDKHDSAILKYFEWKKRFRVELLNEQGFSCSLCEYLNSRDDSTTTIRENQVALDPRNECYDTDAFLQNILSTS